MGYDSCPMTRETFHAEGRTPFQDQPTNMLVTGAVDDLWENARGELIVVD